MPKSAFYIFIVSFALILLMLAPLMVGKEERRREREAAGRIGVIVDLGSEAGKEEKLAMELAVGSFYKFTGCRLALHVKDSGNNPDRAVSAATELIEEKQVQALIGLETWQEAAIVAELGTKEEIPVLSLAETSPSWSSTKWPFLVRLTRNKSMQLKAIAAIVGSWQWQKVTVIYEDMDFVSSTIIPQLSNALLEVDSVIDYQMAFSPSPTSDLSTEFQKLLDRQSRIFIVYTSMKLASQIFSEATRMGMMGKGYVWITGKDITSHLDSVHSSVISSMQGVTGVKDYHPPTSNHIIDQFPGINMTTTFNEMSGLKAFDAVWAVASAMRYNGQCQEHQSLHSNQKRKNSTHELLKAVLASNFTGLSGPFSFDREGTLVSPQYIEVLNVVGKTYRDLGLWSDASGFMPRLDHGRRNISKSMIGLGQIYWPGGAWNVPNRLAPPSGTKKLIIGVPGKSAFPEFVKVNIEASNEKDRFTGFSIDVFNAVWDGLRYDLRHEYVPHNGTYDSLIQEVGKEYDIAVGDISIVSERYQYVQFSQPYAEAGLVMVVASGAGLDKSESKGWIFMKPFTCRMWAVTALLTLYNGFVVWLIERGHHADQRGGFCNQAGLWIWLSFTTLFSHHGEQPRSNLSIITMVVWLFVTIILTSSYTANLTSMLTFQGIQTTALDVDTLRRTNAKIGCDNGSFVANYLANVLQFDRSNIKQFASGDDYAEALTSKEIHAAFLRVPFAKVLVAKHCKEVVITGPTFDVGGFGFAFPKGSPILSDVSQAILELSEKCTLQHLYNEMVSSFNCPSELPIEKLHIDRFWGLFVITGGTATVSLAVYVVQLIRANERIQRMFESLQEMVRRRRASTQGGRSIPSTTDQSETSIETVETNSGLNGVHGDTCLEAPVNKGGES